MIWLVEILWIRLEEQLLIKYYVVKHLTLLKIRNMIYINVNLLQRFINVLIKNLLVLMTPVELLHMQIDLLLKVKLFQTNNQRKNYTNQIKDLKNEKQTPLLKIIFWVVDLADLQLISKYNKRFQFLLCVIHIYSNYA